MRLGGRRFLLSLAIIGAAVCLALGISLPIIRLTKFVFWTSEYSLLSTVEVLIRQGQTFLGVVVLRVLDHACRSSSCSTCCSSRRCPRPSSRATQPAPQGLEWLGKWSMHDVLVLALTIFFIKSQGVYDAASLPAVYFFTAAVVLMILSYAWLQTECSPRAERHGPRAARCSQAPVAGAQLRAQLPHHRGDGVLRARHHPAGDPLHHRLRVDQRALDRDHHLGAVRERASTSCAWWCSCSRSSSRSSSCSTC